MESMGDFGEVYVNPAIERRKTTRNNALTEHDAGPQQPPGRREFLFRIWRGIAQFRQSPCRPTIATLPSARTFGARGATVRAGRKEQKESRAHCCHGKHG
jgi:hypothetical protein